VAICSALVVAVGAGAAWATTATTRSIHADRSAVRPRRTSSRAQANVEVRTARRQPLPGALLIADRGNDRIILVTPGRRWLWHFPTSADLAHGIHLRFNDDAFVAPGGRSIVANEEEAHTIVSIDIKTHARVHLYGVPGVSGSRAGLLDTPDDAYPLPGGVVSVADAYNCRVLYIRDHQIVRQLGETGVCRHDPPSTFGDLNGDTPLPGGGVLVSEIPGSWIDGIGGTGRLLFAFQAPVAYPSDPQPLPGDRILIADYSRPGGVVIVNHQGSVLWSYRVTAGWGELDHPSLAIMLPNGNIAVNDDYRDRVVVIDPVTNRIVWAYGHTDRPGADPGYLRTPDGMDFVPLGASGHPAWARVRHP
jgi:hypothetical protein